MPDFSLEAAAWQQNLPFYGFDEAGFGSSVGSMFVAVVQFPAGLDPTLLYGVRDSKKTTAAERMLLSQKIKTHAERWHVFEVTAAEVDAGSIYWLRYTKPLSWLSDVPSGVTCFDGNQKISCQKHQNTCCVKGDSVSLSIAAASILAKSAKDQECLALNNQYPTWNFINNAGYLTAEHQTKIKTHGALPIHRKTYLKNILKDP